MSTVKFRKVLELFHNRKVRTVRTEQLWSRGWRKAPDGITLMFGDIRISYLFDKYSPASVCPLESRWQPIWHNETRYYGYICQTTFSPSKNYFNLMTTLFTALQCSGLWSSMWPLCFNTDFHDFPGLENGLFKFHDFSWLSMTSGHPGSCTVKTCTLHGMRISYVMYTLH